MGVKLAESLYLALSVKPFPSLPRLPAERAT